jgi:predicted CopG family antitoxin
MEYDEWLPHYYNNNQRFLQKRLDPKVIRDTKIFEKQQIKWICVDDLKRMKKEFRSFYQNIVELILAKKPEIDSFARKSLGRKTIASCKKTYKSSKKGSPHKSRKQHYNRRH